MTPVEKASGQADLKFHADMPHHVVCDIIYAPNSPIRNILRLARRIALSFSPVLITGATGVGKENLARYIHNAGAGAETPFMDLNCGAVPENLFEAELFGHVKGAFTGASANRSGYMASTECGTLFLDEIGEMPLSLQPKLLRALETRMFRPVGSTRQQPFKGRIIAATHRDLASLCKEGRFREDLFYRLAVFSLEIPSLAQRRDDIPALVEYFTSLHKKGLFFTEEGMEYLKGYSWPGNIRELRNLIDRLIILTDTPVTDKPTPYQIPFLCDVSENIFIGNVCQYSSGYARKRRQTGPDGTVADFRRPAPQPKAVKRRPRDFWASAERLWNGGPPS